MNQWLKFLGPLARLIARIWNRELDKKEAQEKTNQKTFDANMAAAKSVKDQAAALLKQAEQIHAELREDITEAQRIGKGLK